MTGFVLGIHVGTGEGITWESGIFVFFPDRVTWLGDVCGLSVQRVVPQPHARWISPMRQSFPRLPEVPPSLIFLQQGFGLEVKLPTYDFLFP